MGGLVGTGRQPSIHVSDISGIPPTLTVWIPAFSCKNHCHHFLLANPNPPLPLRCGPQEIDKNAKDSLRLFCEFLVTITLKTRLSNMPRMLPNLIGASGYCFQPFPLLQPCSLYRSWETPLPSCFRAPSKHAMLSASDAFFSSPLYVINNRLSLVTLHSRISLIAAVFKYTVSLLSAIDPSSKCTMQSSE